MLPFKPDRTLFKRSWGLNIMVTYEAWLPEWLDSCRHQNKSRPWSAQPLRLKAEFLQGILHYPPLWLLLLNT